MPRHPHLTFTSFDLPPVAPLARRHAERAGMADRIEVASGDFFADPLPPADVVTMGNVLHDWSLDNKKALVAAAYEALPEGGAFVAIENLIDDARREAAFGLLMSLNMLIEFGDAFDYTFADFQAWCREAGFRRFEKLPLAGPTFAAVAYKQPASPPSPDAFVRPSLFSARPGPAGAFPSGTAVSIGPLVAPRRRRAEAQPGVSGATWAGLEAAQVTDHVRGSGLPCPRPGKRPLFRPADLQMWAERYPNGAAPEAGADG